MARCPSCKSPAPELHPATQWEGEAMICKDQYHRSTDKGRKLLETIDLVSKPLPVKRKKTEA